MNVILKTIKNILRFFQFNPYKEEYCLLLVLKIYVTIANVN